jgi:tRNA modification GTPase
LRVFVEATIDFSDEEIDFLESHEVLVKLQTLKNLLLEILESANEGAILRDGLYVAIAGKPNAGKSSLLNALTKQPSAIVTDIAGTTRDSIEDEIIIKGYNFRFIDTAGIRKTDDKIENLGIKKTYEKIEEAEIILYLIDGSILNNKNFDNYINEISTLVLNIIKTYLINN